MAKDGADILSAFCYKIFFSNDIYARLFSLYVSFTFSFILRWVLNLNVARQYCHFTSTLTRKRNPEKIEYVKFFQCCFLFLKHCLDNGDLQTHNQIYVKGSAKVKVPQVKTLIICLMCKHSFQPYCYFIKILLSNIEGQNLIYK